MSLRDLCAAALCGAVLVGCTGDKDQATDSSDPEVESTDGTTDEPSGTTDEPSGTTDEPSGTTDEPSGTTDEGTTDPTEGSGEEDFVEMSECGLPVVCEPFTYVTGPDDDPDQVPPLPECLWTGLRDGTPGRYTWISDQEADNGQFKREHLIHVHADRKVTFAVSYEEDIWEGGDEGLTTGFEPARTCSLAEPEFFADCLQNPDKFYGCTQEQKWWIDCVEDGPKCE